MTNATQAIRTAKKAIIMASLGSGLFMLQEPGAFAHHAECTINWDDRAALSKIYDQARTSFVVPTTIGPDVPGKPPGQNLVGCKTNGNSALDNPSCWQ